MRGYVLISLLLVIFSSSAAAHSVKDAVVIHTTDNGFVPSEIEVKVGEKIIFENVGEELHWPASDVHPTHEEYSAFDPRRPIPPLETWEFVFTDPGKYDMHDHLAPQFIGSITVIGESKKPNQVISEFLTGLLSFMLRIPIFSNSDQKPIPEITVAVTAEIDHSTPTNIDTNFHKPQESTWEEVEGSYPNYCESYDNACIYSAIKNITIAYGPEKALRLVHTLLKEGKIHQVVEIHQVAHRIGRATAEEFGVAPESFFLCTTDFNYGCQHGFFEHVLGKTGSGRQAIRLICDPINDSYSSKFKFYCYHGAGHGVLMATAYNLDDGLAMCDSLDTFTAQEGCWQGLFMENVNAGIRDEARSGIFSDIDPLAPCSVVGDKYRFQCYINHAGWMIRFFNNSLSRAADACLNAENHIDPCMQSLGLMVTNPAWQYTLTGGSKEPFIDIAWSLCQEFPESYLEQCMIAAVDNIHNFDELDAIRSIDFCSEVVSEDYKTRCFQQIGINLKGQALDKQQIEHQCSIAPLEFQDECKQGGGI